MLTKRSITLLRGVPSDAFFDLLKKRKAKNIFVLEGRPRVERTNEFCKQLLKEKISPTLIADNMAGYLFYKDLVKEIWLSYQSLDNGGASCDIGALILGVLGKTHGVPVYIFPAAEKINSVGNQVEISKFHGKQIAPKGIKGHVPLVEYLPKKYISDIYALECSCCACER